MIITELNQIVLTAVAAGFFGGSCQSLLSYILDKNERQLFSDKFIVKFLYFSVSYSIILGVIVFALSVWDTSMSAAKVNRFTIAIATFLAIAPIYNRFISFIFSIFSQFKLFDKNTTDN